MIPDVLSALSRGTEASSRINAWRNRLKGDGALLTEELKDNLIYLDMGAKGETDVLCNPGFPIATENLFA